ncbi:MAG: methylhydantoinase, partial [Alphaproteobacteria bacterium]|nr:methylhydantoinase [Alphaproteobacteria bacterium]
SLFGGLAGRKDVIAFDMGGTTAKASMVQDGRVEIAPMMEAARVHRFTKGSGLPIKSPVIDMIEIGAGGGSIAWIDEVGLLKVGPHSAGSDPGPACYARGGTEPTVTDANLVLGYYDPGFFLGGRMPLDAAAAERALRRIAEPLGMSVTDAALGIHRVVTESMAAAARVHLVEKGKDPRRYAMVGFGGAGPAHAAGVARALGVSEVIIPPASGAASALGFLAAPLSFELARSHPLEFARGFDARGAEAVLRELEGEARRQLEAAGVSSADMRVERSADMRLIGQMHDVNVPLPASALDEASLAAVHVAFATVYAQRYIKPYAGARIEALNFRVRCSGPAPELAIRGAAGGGDRRTRIKGERRCVFAGGPVRATVYDRYALEPGDRIAGPAIIEEREATTVVPPGDEVRVETGLDLVITVAPTAAAAPTMTSDMPLAAAMDAIEADPISLEIMWSRLINVVEEMWHTVCRTAFSLVISEAQDFACDLLDTTGDPLAHSPRAMPVFNLTLPRTVKALLAEFPIETLKPGDVLCTNDPWLCVGHLFDIAVVSPVFFKGKVVGVAASVGNVADIGGTKDWLHAREIYEEGFQIPPMKIYNAGKPDATFFKLFARNVRLSEQVIGDIHSLIAANAVGAERLVAFMRDYGMRDLRALTAVVQNRSERAMRDAIRAMPDGTYPATLRNNPLGTMMEYRASITIADDTIAIDYADVPPQLPQAGFNCTLNYTEAHTTYPLKCLLTPGVRGNAGCYRPMRVTAKEGTLLNCTYPAAVNLRHRTGWCASPAIFRALSQALPGNVIAATGLPFSASIYGRTGSGGLYSDLLFMGGGQGASSRSDGRGGLIWPTSAANTSIELFESRVPVIVLEKALLPDTGGAGEFRGGPAQRMRLRKLYDDGLPTLVTVYPESVGNPIEGLFGGKPGGMSHGRVLDPDGTVRHDCGTGDLVELARPDAIIEVVVTGGAGFGDPRRRSRAAIERDLVLGWITPAGAHRDYGREP